MPELLVKVDARDVASFAAGMAASAIEQAIMKNGHANWVLAGGTAPIEAYKEISSRYKEGIDWQGVKFVFGDERIVEINSPESNFVQIKEALFNGLPIKEENILRPKYELTTEEAAEAYEAALEVIKGEKGIPRFDHLWLGIGEDGHTLSLFPGKTEAQNDKLVAPVHDSPKPPPDRITLTLKALGDVGSALIIALGEKKADVVKRIVARDNSLPAVAVISKIESSGGNVTMLMDKEAASLIF